MITLPIYYICKRLNEIRNTLLNDLLIDLSARDLSRRILISVEIRCFNIALASC